MLTLNCLCFEIRLLKNFKIIKDLQYKEEEEEGHERKAATVHRVSHGIAMDDFATFVKWVKKNGVAACDILKLKRIRIKISIILCNSFYQTALCNQIRVENLLCPMCSPSNYCLFSLSLYYLNTYYYATVFI